MTSQMSSPQYHSPIPGPRMCNRPKHRPALSAPRRRPGARRNRAETWRVFSVHNSRAIPFSYKTFNCSSPSLDPWRLRIIRLQSRLDVTYRRSHPSAPTFSTRPTPQKREYESNSSCRLPHSPCGADLSPVLRSVGSVGEPVWRVAPRHLWGPLGKPDREGTRAARNEIPSPLANTRTRPRSRGIPGAQFIGNSKSASSHLIPIPPHPITWRTSLRSPWPTRRPPQPAGKQPRRPRPRRRQTQTPQRPPQPPKATAMWPPSTACRSRRGSAATLRSRRASLASGTSWRFP